MLADLMGGAIDFTIDNISSSLELIKSKKLHAIAVTSRNRSPLLPELPTMIESGMPGYVMAPWFCVAAPAGTPTDVVKKLNLVLNDMLEDRSEEHTSELQSLMRISYAVFCLKNKNNNN